jgi:hypothetical protein
MNLLCILIALQIMPIIAAPQIKQNSSQPAGTARRPIKHTGEYVPAISKKIVQWSKILNTAFALHTGKK